MNTLPFFALMTIAKERRGRLLPLALPAVAGVPAAQAGTMAVVVADSVARQERNAANANASAAVRAVLSKAVEKGARLTPEDLKEIPLAYEIVQRDPSILTPAGEPGAPGGDQTDGGGEDKVGRTGGRGGLLRRR